MQYKSLRIAMFALVAVANVQAHLPIVLVHGVLADKYAMQPTIKYIKKHMPGTYVRNVIIGEGRLASFANMYDQARWLAEEVQGDAKLKNGFNLIAHSQGGLVARYYIERYNKPRVHNFITWGSPHRGVFGMPGTLDDFFTWFNTAEKYSYKVLYSYPCQKFLSFAGYWNDPLHHAKYLKKCKFLPYLNNEKNHEFSKKFKKNICKLQNFVMVNSTRETIIEPTISCHFGFDKTGSAEQMEYLSFYEGFVNDKLGLKTLYVSGRLHMKIAHCTHENYQEDEHNFVHNTLPYLQLEPVSATMPSELPAAPIAEA